MKKSLFKVAVLLFILIHSLKAYSEWDSAFYEMKQKIFIPNKELIDLDSLKHYYKIMHHQSPDSTIGLLRSMYYWSKTKNDHQLMHHVLLFLTESLVWSSHTNNNEEIMYNIFEGIDYATINDETQLLIKYYTLLAGYFRAQDNYKQAYYYHLLALKEAKSENDYLSIVFHNLRIGNIFLKTKLYEKALEAYRQNIKIAEHEDLTDNTDLMLTHIQMMKIYYYLDKMDSVDYYYKRVVQDTTSQSMPWFNKYRLYKYIGDYYLEIGEVDKAKNFYETIINNSTAKNIDFQLGHTYTRLAYVAELKKNHREQLKYNRLALENRKKSDSKTHIGSSYANLANAYLNLSENDTGIYYLRKAFQIHKDRDVIDHYLPYTAYKLYEYFFDIANNNDSALKYYRLYNIYTDSLNAKKNQQKLQSMNFDWMFKEKQLKLQQLGQENQTKSFAIISLALIFILVIVLFILIIRQYKQRMRSQHIELRDKIIRSQLNPHFIFNSLIAIQAYVYQNKPTKAAGYIADFAKLMRHFLNNSRSDLIKLKDEVETLHYYFRLQSIRFKDKLDFSIAVGPELDSDETLLPPGLAQPFIENAIEHGIQHKEGKGRVELRIFRIEKTIHIEIEDDGIGYKSKLNTKKGNKHLSLATLISHERIDNINKRFKGKEKLKFSIRLAKPERENPGTLVTFIFPEKMTLKQ